MIVNLDPLLSICGCKKTSFGSSRLLNEGLRVKGSRRQSTTRFEEVSSVAGVRWLRECEPGGVRTYSGRTGEGHKDKRRRGNSTTTKTHPSSSSTIPPQRSISPDFLPGSGPWSFILCCGCIWSDEDRTGTVPVVSPTKPLVSL